MKIQSNFAYYNTAFLGKRLRMENFHKNPLMGSKINQMYPSSTPSLSIYVYGDNNSDIDINQRTYDSFTGLRDKQYLLAVLNKSITNSAKDKNDISLAMFDMDNFKSVNELLGYDTGDDFIQFISQTIDKVASDNSLNAYRFGGDEFVVLFKNQDKEQQKRIVSEVLEQANSNSYIKSKEDEYRANAERRLFEYMVLTEKITTLNFMKSKKEIYENLESNFETYEAKNDPYLIKSILENNNDISDMYMHLLSERLREEDDCKILLFLRKMTEKFQKHQPIDKSDQKLLDEYLQFHYDKSEELYQTRKWLDDFNENNGFSITGTAVTFKHDLIGNKTARDLIGIAGESLKRGKYKRKGKSYSECIT